MKINNDFSLFGFLMSTAIVLSFIGIPFLTYYSAANQAKIINVQCNTNYNTIDMLLNGDTITQLCQVKEQTLTIK